MIRAVLGLYCVLCVGAGLLTLVLLLAPVMPVLADWLGQAGYVVGQGVAACLVLLGLGAGGSLLLLGLGGRDRLRRPPPPLYIIDQDAPRLSAERGIERWN